MVLPLSIASDTAPTILLVFHSTLGRTEPGRSLDIMSRGCR